MLVKQPKFETWNWSIISPNHETSRHSRYAGYWFVVRMGLQIKFHNLIKRNDRAWYVWGNISQLQTISDPGRSHCVHQERMYRRRTNLQCSTEFTTAWNIPTGWKFRLGKWKPTSFLQTNTDGWSVSGKVIRRPILRNSLAVENSSNSTTWGRIFRILL